MNRDRKSFPSRRKTPDLFRWLATLTFLIRLQAFWDPLNGELPYVQIFMNDWPNPLTWDAQFLSSWFSRNPAVFQDKLVNLMNNLRGGQCSASSRTRRNTGGKITTLFLISINWRKTRAHKLSRCSIDTSKFCVPKWWLEACTVLTVKQIRQINNILIHHR